MTDNHSAEEWNELLRVAGLTPRSILFKNNWDSASDGSPAADAIRTSLAALASESDELKSTLRKLLGVGGGHLELHMNGRGITHHSTNAKKLGDFIKKTSRALNEIAKSESGRSRLHDRILVTAPVAGSVAVTFSVEQHYETGNEIPGTATSEIEEVAIKRLVSIFLQAEDQVNDIESTVLDAAIHTLRGPAQRSLRELAKSISNNGWEVDGVFYSRGQEVPVKMSRNGLSRVIDVTRSINQVEETLEATGKVDSWAWSKQTMGFERENGAIIEAFVPEQLSHEVAEWIERHEQVNVKFRVIIVFPPGDRAFERKSYYLTSISPIDHLPFEN
jgi:hypothetical protein